MYDVSPAVVPSMTASVRAVGMLILAYTVVGVLSEHRWGRRGLLVSWLVSAAILPVWTLARLRWGSGVMSEPSGRHIVWGVTASYLGWQLVTFGASALSLRFTGVAAAHPRRVWVRVCASLAVGGIGALIATVLLFIAVSMSYASSH